MNDKELRLFLDLFMCSDPWPLSDEAHEILTDFIERESKARGYDNWIDAYHRFPGA